MVHNHWLVVWNHGFFRTFPSYWECHHPNWLISPWFFRGPTSHGRSLEHLERPWFFFALRRTTSWRSWNGGRPWTQSTTLQPQSRRLPGTPRPLKLPALFFGGIICSWVHQVFTPGSATKNFVLLLTDRGWRIGNAHSTMVHFYRDLVSGDLATCCGAVALLRCCELLILLRAQLGWFPTDRHFCWETRIIPPIPRVTSNNFAKVGENTLMAHQRCEIVGFWQKIWPFHRTRKHLRFNFWQGTLLTAMVRGGAVGSLMEENVIESPAIVWISTFLPRFQYSSWKHKLSSAKKEQRRTKFTDHGKFGSSHIQTYEFSQPILGPGGAPRRCVHDALGYGPGVGTVSSVKIGPSWVKSC